MAHFFSGFCCDGAGLVGEELLEGRDHARIAGRFLILRQDLEHDHVRPPVLILLGSEEAVLALVVERPVDPFAGLADQFGVVEQVGQRNQPIEVIRTALPAFALAAEPRAVGGEVGPELVDVPGQSVALDFELLQQPAGRLDRARAAAGRRRWE